MSVEVLARVQFTFTAAVHYIYPPLSIWLGVLLVTMEALWLRTGNLLFHNMARFWTRIFALTFAIGVATGIARKLPAARYASLALLGVTLLKLFFHDLAQLNQLYRIGAFVGVAVILLAASFLYQKFVTAEEKLKS